MEKIERECIVAALEIRHFLESPSKQAERSMTKVDRVIAGKSILANEENRLMRLTS